MDIPDPLIDEVDKLLLRHRYTFVQAMSLFKEKDLFEMMDKLMTHSMNLKDGFEAKHVFILFALGKALVNNGYSKEQVKQCQMKMLETHGVKKERQCMYPTFFNKIFYLIFAEMYALLWG
jgi:hypothetical protein